MTIERAISDTVYTQLVTTTSILAKLVACAILLASIANAQAANDDGSNQTGASRRSNTAFCPVRPPYSSIRCRGNPFGTSKSFVTRKAGQSSD